jgi:hypothetical protein
MLESGPCSKPRQSAVEQRRSAKACAARSVGFECSWREAAIGDGTADAIVVLDQVTRCLVPGECFSDLLRHSSGGRKCREIDEKRRAPLQTQDSEIMQKLENDDRGLQQGRKQSIKLDEDKSVGGSPRDPTRR